MQRRQRGSTPHYSSEASEVYKGQVLGPAPFEAPFTNWTWQIVAPSADAPGSPHEIIIRHADPELVRRLAQIVLVPSRTAAAPDEADPEQATADDPLTAP